MRLNCYVPSQIIPKSRVVHLADNPILKRHILSYPKMMSPNIPPGGGGGGGGRRVSIPGPWTKRCGSEYTDRLGVGTFDWCESFQEMLDDVVVFCCCF